ncbi:hypothetical protein GCM10009547_11550 [Sporichthya brevicatena]|uniref:Uncharacterized protein n=1 Tax=Sporichthya brevicatena TaxID=171442 RepID=A0ABN1GGT4_9ACTN
MPLLLAIFPLIGRLLHKLLRSVFNKSVRKALTKVFGPIWRKVGQPVWTRTGEPLWRRLWREAPQKQKIRKQFDAVSHCPNCNHFAVTHVERLSSHRVILKVVPGPTVGEKRLRAVCSACAHVRPVRDAPEIAPLLN